MGLFGKKYACQTCGMKFGSEEELREHGKMHMSPQAPAQKFACKTCGASFNTQAELMQHSQKAHQMQGAQM